MLTNLTIKNYALIDELNVGFNTGLTIITGETGAGKSILLGGLSLILGKRADLSSVKDSSKKCIIEATFDIAKYNLKSVFKTEDLDYEAQTIVRREILPSGKSRAFINDTPVNLGSLQILGERLLDIHSQHQTLQLTNDNFQFQVIDALANNEKSLMTYSSLLKEFKALKSELKDLQDKKNDAVKELDYHTFLLNELEEAKLIAGEDMNVMSAYAQGVTGQGVTAVVVDSALEIRHEDLEPNVLVNRSLNIKEGAADRTDPSPAGIAGDHGTSVAGLIAAKGWNGLGGRGVAPDTSLIGMNFLGGGNVPQAEYLIHGFPGSGIAKSDNVGVFNRSYGLGWRIVKKRNNYPRIIYHLGWWRGYRLSLIHISEPTRPY